MGYDLQDLHKLVHFTAVRFCPLENGFNSFRAQIDQHHLVDTGAS